MSEDVNQDQQHEEASRSDRWVDAVATLVLIAIAITAFTYWLATQG